MSHCNCVTLFIPRTIIFLALGYRICCYFQEQAMCMPCICVTHVINYSMPSPALYYKQWKLDGPDNKASKTINLASYPGSSPCRKTGREPGRFDHVPRDVQCVVLCMVLIIELLLMHSDSNYCPVLLNARPSLLLELWMLLGLTDLLFYHSRASLYATIRPFQFNFTFLGSGESSFPKSPKKKE